MTSRTSVWRRLKTTLCACACTTVLCGSFLVAPLAAHADSLSIWLYNSQDQLINVTSSFTLQGNHIFCDATGQDIGAVSEPSGNILDANGDIIGVVEDES